MGDTEIFNKAQQSEDEYKIGELKDRISTVILDWETEKRIPETAESTDLEDLWGKFVDADIIDNPEEDIYNQEETDIYEVTTNEGYVVEIIVKEDGTVEIGDIVKGDNLPPRIGEITSSGTSSSIHVEVNITRSEGKVSISFYYKKDGEEDSSYKALKENVADLTADFTGLEQNVIYNIKVVVTDDNGSTEKVISEITGKLAEGTISQVGETQWNDGTATIQLETTGTAVTQMVYQKAVNKLEVGDYVYYQATNTSYANTRTYDGRTEIINPSSYTNGWQVLSNDGTTIQIISSKTVPELNLARATGFQHLVEDADRYCASYADGNLVTGGRAAGSYGMKQVITENDYAIGASYTLVHEEPTHDIQLITNAGLQNVGGPWDLAARYANPVATKPGSVNYGSWTYTYSGSIVHTIYFTVNSSNGLPTDSRDHVLALRPILTLKSDAVVTSGDGDSLETAYHLK